MLVETVKGVDVFDPAQHIEPALRAARKHNVKETYQFVLDNILMQFTHQHGWLFFYSLPATLNWLWLDLY